MNQYVYRLQNLSRQLKYEELGCEVPTGSGAAGQVRRNSGWQSIDFSERGAPRASFSVINLPIWTNLRPSIQPPHVPFRCHLNSGHVHLKVWRRNTLISGPVCSLCACNDFVPTERLSVPPDEHLLCQALQNPR